MAGLFSKKSKKEKEEKTAAKNAAAASAINATSISSVPGVPASTSNISSIGPPGSTGSIASSTSNPPSGTKPGATTTTMSGAHMRDNSISASASALEYATQHQQQQQQQQPQLQQQQQQQYGMQASSSKSSFDNDKARVYHLQQQHQGLNNVVSASSISTHNSFANSNGPWLSVQVMSVNPFPRFSHTASYVQTGTDIYIFGGIVKDSAQKDLHVIDFQSLRCQVLPAVGADSPPPTTGHTAVILGQYIMYFGGKDAKNKCSDALYVLHTVRKEWNRPIIHGLLPAPRHSHAACVIGTTMYIFGGQFNGYYLNDIASFDMKTLNTASPKWNRLEPSSELPPARAGHCAAAHDGKIYIFGGADEQFFYNDIWCYDPQTNKWEAVPAFGVLPTSRQGHAASVVDDTMYIYGGVNHEDQLLGDLSAFKFYDRRWLTFPDTVESPSPRAEHAMCTVGDKIYILGGQLEPNADDDAGSVYILDTTKIKYHEPSLIGSQRPAYDNDSTLRVDGIQDDSNPSSQRPTPSLNSNRQHNDLNYDTRRAFQLQQQSQQQHPEAHDHYSNHSAIHSPRFLDEPNTGAHSQMRRSLDGPDLNSASRRRMAGKSSNYVVHEIEPRTTQSIDETRRPGMLENDHYAQGQRPMQLDNGVYPASQQQQQQQQQQHQHQQQQDLIRRQSLDNRSRGTYTQVPLMPLRTSIDQTGTAVVPTGTPSSQNTAQQDSSDPQFSSKDIEIRELKQREQWLLAEVAMARKKMGEGALNMMVALKEDMGAFNADRDSEKYQIMQALLSVKAELERSKTSIVTQAQVVSNKLREAERVRTAALQEAAYLKAKVSALQSGEASSLVMTETVRAVDLEKRLTVALALVDKLQSQSAQHDATLERERHARETAFERERQTTARAEEAELSHTRSLVELATLHERASKAEASLRECEAKNAANEAGLSSYQQQSTALFSQISALKTTVDHQKKSLEKVKLAYSVASDRAEHADRLWTQARQEIDNTHLEFASVRADLERAQREAEHWKAKAQDTDLLWQKAKNENETMRTLLEEDMNASTYTPGTNSRKHDSIMAITSASRVAELEHELGTLRHLLRESQAAAAQANKDLGEAMVRISQLEQTSMTARAEAATAQRQLTASEDKVAALETQLSQKEEALEEMAKEQENNEVQLGVLRGVMRENGLLADDLILEALSQGADGKPVVASPTTMTGLKSKVQYLEKRVQDSEVQLEEMNALKDQQKERIQQLEADYQTAVHYVQGSESMLQRLRDEAQAAKNEKDATLAKFQELEAAHAQCSDLRASASEAASAAAAAAAATLQLQEEISDLHRQLHDAMGRSMELEQKMEEMTGVLQGSEAAVETTQAELKALKAKHHEHKKQGAISAENYQTKLEQLETTVHETQASLAETQQKLEASQRILEQAQALSKSKTKELDEALVALKDAQEAVAAAKDVSASQACKRDLEEEKKRDAAALEAEQKRAAAYAAHQEDLELVIDNAQKTIQELLGKNLDLEQQLRVSENKISILLDNFQGPDSVRNSVASLSGGDDLILRLLEANQQQQHILLSGTTGRSHLTPMSHGSNLTDRSSADSLANELEMLRSNWGQAQLNGTIHRPGDIMTAAAAAAAEGGNGTASAEAETLSAAPSTVDPSGTTASTNGGEMTGSDTTAVSSAPVAAAKEFLSSTLVSSSPPSTLTSAQKLEEYEKMIEDMANTRRQYEE